MYKDHLNKFKVNMFSLMMDIKEDNMYNDSGMFDEFDITYPYEGSREKSSLLWYDSSPTQEHKYIQKFIIKMFDLNALKYFIEGEVEFSYIYVDECMGIVNVPTWKLYTSSVVILNYTKLHESFEKIWFDEIIQKVGRCHNG